jgi:hypothetical protein
VKNSNIFLNMQLILVVPGKRKISFNFSRFCYLGVPLSKDIRTENVTLRIKKDSFAQKLFNMFSNHADWSDATKLQFLSHFSEYVAHCDKAGVDPCSKKGISVWYEHINNKHILGELIDSTCRSKVSAVKSVMRNLDLPVDLWTINQITFGNTQSQTIQAYSDTDIKKLLLLLMRMFNQLYDQFIKRPLYYISQSQQSEHFNLGTDCSMDFIWHQNTIKIYIPITKLVCLSCYLLAYYSWGNTTQLFEIKRPDFDGQTLKEMWAKMPAFKRRANKYISIELGENDSLKIPKHAVTLFNKILTISTLIDPEPGARLLNCVQSGRVQSVTSTNLSQFNRWIKKHIDLRDDFNRNLVPRVQRFRASGTSRFQVYTSDSLKPSIITGNSPQVMERFYSDGSKYDNDLQIQASSYTLENSARDRMGIEDAKQTTKDQMKVAVLPYDSYVKLLSPPNRNVNGSFCSKPFGDRADKQNLKAIQRKILKHGERLACADLLKCFECQDQVIVESIEELWCILSFRQCLEESAYLHLDRDHFKKNFGQVLRNIDYRLAQVNKTILHSAELKLSNKGRHPLWLDTENVSITSEKVNA